jgi:hypothetical protein
MNRHDWATLGLIGVSALGGMGLTSVLFVRHADAGEREIRAVEHSTRVEYRWSRATPSKPRPARGAPTGVMLNWWPDRRLIPTDKYGSYGLTLDSRATVEPIEQRILVFGPNKTRLVPRERILPIRRTATHYDFKFRPR